MGYLLVLLAGMLGLGFLSKQKAQGEPSPHPTDVKEFDPEFFTTNELPDVLPANQGGNFSREFDTEFWKVSQETGVPFALLKAEAIRESSLRKDAVRNEPGTKTRPPSASYGLMQPLWWQDSERFTEFGYPDDALEGGEALFDPYLNVYIGACILRDGDPSKPPEKRVSLKDGLRNGINAYNTGVDEKTRKAPGNYVNDVLKYYSTLVGREIS